MITLARCTRAKILVARQNTAHMPPCYDGFGMDQFLMKKSDRHYQQFAIPI